MVSQCVVVGPRRSPAIHQRASPAGTKDANAQQLIAKHWEVGNIRSLLFRADELLFTENETNSERLFGVASRTPYVKDAFDTYLIAGKREALNPAATGTKSAAHYARTINPGETLTVDLRLASSECRTRSEGTISWASIRC